MRFSLIIFLIVFFAALPLQAAAEDSEEPSNDNPGDPKIWGPTLEEVVVTGTRTEHSASDSPVPIEIITAKEIEASGAVNAGDALDHVSGLFLDEYESASRGGPGSGVNLQGMPTNRVLVLIDGQRIPKTMRAPDLELIPANIIDRIEVVKGPHSALYGSDAAGGVINIITKQPSKDLALEGDIGYGSFNTFRGDVMQSYTYGPFGYLLSFNHESSEGWIDENSQKPVIRIGEGPDGFTLVENDNKHPHELNDIFGKTVLDIGTVGKWSLQSRYHWEDNFWSDKDGGKITDDKTRLDIQTGLDFFLGDAGEFSVNGYFFRHTLRYREFESVYVWDIYDPDIMNRSYIDKGNDTVTESSRGETKYTVLLGGFNLLTLGFDYRYETLLYGASEDSIMTDDTQNFFAYQSIVSGILQDEIFLFDGRWNIVPGARIDYHPVWGTEVNPKLSTMGKLYTSEPYNLTLRGSIGRAFTAPALSELYRQEFRHTGYYLTGNEDLDPEVAWGWNAEIEHSLYNHLRFKHGYFQYEIEDMIWLDIADNDYNGLPLQTYRNIKNARIWGLDASLSVRPHPYVSIQAQYTYTKTTDLEEDTSLGTVAANQASGQFFFDITPTGTGGYLSVGWFDTRDYIGMGGLWYAAEPQWVTRLRLYQRLLDHVEFYIEANNLLNYQWDRESDGDNDMPPFNLFGGIKFWL